MSQFPGGSLSYASDYAVVVPPLAGRARAARIALICTLIATACLTALLFMVPHVNELMEQHDPASASTLMVLGLVLLTGSCGQMASFVVSVVLYCMWIH